MTPPPAPQPPAPDAEREGLPTLLAIELAGTVLSGIHDEPLEYVLRRGYAAMGMRPGLAADMCQKLADCQTEDHTTLTADRDAALAEVKRLRDALGRAPMDARALIVALTDCPKCGSPPGARCDAVGRCWVNGAALASTSEPQEDAK